MPLDLGDYYRVPVDDRDLNYALYFSEGQPEQSQLDDYNSHNTRRLSAVDVEHMVAALPEVATLLASR